MNIQEKTDKVIQDIKTYLRDNPIKHEPLLILCKPDYYTKLLKNLPARLKIDMELRRRGLKRKHIHKARRNK